MLRLWIIRSRECTVLGAYICSLLFEEERKYHPSCCPSNYKSEDPDDDLDYGPIKDINEARDYHYTFNPFFYTREAADRYKWETYGEDSEEEQDDKAERENEEDDDIIEKIWGTIF